MKKNYSNLKVLLLCLISLQGMAQVVNGNFENVKTNFLPSNWGMNFFQQVIFDPETGEQLSDQIQYTWCIPSMVYASTDAQSGQYAMEISNAFNATQNIVIPGSATIFSDSEQDFPGWNAGIPVEQGANISMLGFYYKFIPSGNDIAQANIQVMNTDGNEIGHASIDISGTNNQFMYIYMPITYTINATPAFMTISFKMAKEGSTPAFGSRLIVDNVVTNFSALGVVENTNVNTFSFYPTIAENELNIIPGNLQSTIQGTPISYKIVNTEGRVVKQNTVADGSNYIYTMDVSSLSSGMYFLHVESKTGSVIKKFIKK